MKPNKWIKEPKSSPLAVIGVKHRGSSTPFDNVAEVEAEISRNDLQKTRAVEFGRNEWEIKEPSVLQLKTMRRHVFSVFRALSCLMNFGNENKATATNAWFGSHQTKVSCFGPKREKRGNEPSPDSETQSKRTNWLFVMFVEGKRHLLMTLTS